MNHKPCTEYLRTDYPTLKIWFLDSAYRYFIHKFSEGRISSWSPNESEWGYASYQFENSYELPIEN